jgi:hypothetical protein
MGGNGRDQASFAHFAAQRQDKPGGSGARAVAPC